MALPQLVLFSVKDAAQEVRYLSFTGPQRQLRCGIEEGVFSENARFGIEQAGDGLVHIRSCYENHYWARSSRFEPWLVASSPEAVEDMTKDGCTLFRPRMSAGNVFVGFVHAQSGLNVVMRPTTDAYAYNLCVEQAPSTDFSYTDFQPFTRTKLPRYIMFLGDNNRYLSARAEQQSTTLHFTEFNNPTDRAVGFEVSYTKSGDFQVKSTRFNGFWRALEVSNQIVVHTGNEPDFNDVYTLFEAAESFPPNTREVGISLRSCFFKSFCYRARNFTGPQYLFTGLNVSNVTDAWFRIRHAALPEKRRVKIEDFRHARVAARSTRFLVTRGFANTDNKDVEDGFSVNYRENTRTTYSSSIAFFKGPSAVFNRRMPSVSVTGELEFPDVATDDTAEWGTTKLITGSEKAHRTTFIIPAGFHVQVTLFMNIVTYEIPFTYQQLDELPFGGTITQHLYDGVLTLQSEYDVGRNIDYSIYTHPEAFDAQLGLDFVGVFEIKEKNEGSDREGDLGIDSSDQGTDAQDDGSKPDASDQTSHEI